MNILVVSQYYDPEPFRINEICEALVMRGHHVTVLTANPNYPDGELYEGYQNRNTKETIRGVTVYRCKCRPRHKGALNLARNYIDFVFHANSEILKIGGAFDCIYVYQLSPVTSCLPAIRYQKKHHIPMLLYCLDIWPESLKGSFLGNALGLKVFGVLSRYIYRSADKIAVTSPAFLDYLHKTCGIGLSSMEYIPQHAKEMKPAQGRDLELHDFQEYVNFLFVGNIGEAQNLECLMNAVSLVKDRKKMKIHIVGSGSRYDACVKLSEDLNIKDTVLFHGRHPKSDLPKYYAMADVCYVSLKEAGTVGSTIPGKVQEYMSAGKPILACMNGDTAELIRSAACGICVPAGDERELAKALAQMASPGARLEEMGKRARAYYEDNFTIDSHIDRLEKCLGELLK